MKIETVNGKKAGNNQEKYVFKDREILRSSVLPNKMIHRESEIGTLKEGIKDSKNIVIYGKTGSGKTSVVKYAIEELLNEPPKEKDVLYIYINCAVVDTQYRLLQNIANHLINEWTERIPFSGWSIDNVFVTLKNKLQQLREGKIVLVLDEIGKLKGTEAIDKLVNLSKQLKNQRINFILISDDLKYTEYLNPETKDVLSEMDLIFSPYTRTQIEDILNEKIQLAFEENKVDEQVVSFISSFVVKDEHGDVRRAVDILRTAGELVQYSEDLTEKQVTKKHVHLALKKLDEHRLKEIIFTLPTQSKMILNAVKNLQDDKKIKDGFSVDEIYEKYKELCESTELNVLTKRRVADLISELDMLGVVSSYSMQEDRRKRKYHLLHPSIFLEE